MTRFERRLFFDTLILGIALTLLIVALDYSGNLNVLELILDDRRARYFQHFRPPPTDQLVFLDIDDPTLDLIGAWVWPRQKWARILDEIYLAQPKAVGLDVMFSERQDPTGGRPGEPLVDHDQLFADSIRKFDHNPGGGGVLLPVDITVTDPTVNWPLRNAMIGEYIADLELTDDEIIQRLKAHGINPPKLEALVVQNESAAYEAAMFQRLNHELTAGHNLDIEVLRKVLLPRSAASGVRTQGLNVLETTLPKVFSYHQLLRFAQPYQGGLPPLFSGDSEIAPIPILAHAAQYSAFVDFFQTGDSKVRFIPLEMLDRGRLIPQFALTLACVHLGVDTRDLKLAPNSITIPRKNAPDIVIPVHAVQSPERGAIGMVMDIPWFGSRDWRTMYDYPKFQQIKQHIPLTNVWDICQISPAIVANDRAAVEDAVTAAQDPTIRTQHPEFDDADGWNKLLTDIVTSIPIDPNDYKPYLDGSKSTDLLTDTAERNLVEQYRTLTNRVRLNKALVAQRAALREKLKNAISGRTVMVGWIASGNVDMKTTPLHDECPGVDIHGAIFNAIVSNYFLSPAPKWIGVTVTGVACLLSALAASKLEPRRALFIALTISAVLVLNDFFIIYDWGRTEVNTAGPAAGPAVIWGACTLWRFINEQRERARITARFSSYADPRLVNYVLEHPEQVTFDGQERELSVVFTDLAGFTTISELLKEKTVALLNKYLGIMVPIVSDSHGLVNKFLGDGIMFFFGAPDPHPKGESYHAQAAVQCVLDMQQAMLPFNEELRAQGLPILKMRAGISTGAMVVGDAGNPPARSDYTVLGDRVNFASRLESANKYTGTLVLISDRTVELLKGKYLVRQMGRLQVVGKKEPVMTYEPLCPVEKATDEMHKLVSMTQAMVDAYIAAKFLDCMALSHELLQAFGEGQAKFCQLYRHLCAQYLEHPPTEFLGQIILESK